MLLLLDNLFHCEQGNAIIVCLILDFDFANMELSLANNQESI